MATITGISKEAAEAILGGSVVSGTINANGHLILVRENGQTIDAGDFTTIISDLIEDQLGVAAVFKNTVTGTVATDQISATVTALDNQTALVQHWVNSVGGTLAKVAPDGAFTAQKITGTIIDANVNALQNVSATKIQGHLTTVGPTAPGNPAVGDLWFQTA